MTAEELDDLFELSKLEMDHSIEHLERELKRINTGKANPEMVGGVMVEY